ncbi:MAG: (2Fe-2S)-binding protein [bacterium]|nr:(2Fe-2S)-binding protein [bacterium]MCY3925515.1 (2Fe-2S)-binding protein [bacterium]
MSTHDITVTVNGTATSASVEARRSLADFLRHDLGLVGTHIGCEQGACGACTVLIGGRSVRSCIMFAVQADGAEIQTIESLAPGADLHPLQEAFRRHQGLQCGFCTPGMLLRGLELISDNPDLTAEEAREGISSNMCRCTGYQYIVDAVLDAAAEMRAEED